MSNWFSSVVVVLFDGAGWDETYALNSHQFLQRNGVVFTEWHGITFARGPNLRALFSGDTWTNDEQHSHFRPSLASEMRKGGVETIQWNYRADDGVCLEPYVDLVTPGIKVVHGNDMDLNSLPPRAQVIIGMDEQNHGRSGTMMRVDGNLREIVGRLDASKWFNSTIDGKYPLLFVVWLRDMHEPGKNHVWAALYGRSVKANLKCDIPHNHYSFPKTCMANWNLPPLNEANRPALITDVWK